MEIKMDLVGITLDPITRQPIALLEDSEKTVQLPIWIGMSEATTIAVVLENIQMPRPFTLDIVTRLLGKLGVKVKKVVITRLEEKMYYALLYYQMPDAEEMVAEDMRPSDAMGIAVRVPCPIFVESEVLAKAGVPFKKSDEEEGRTETEKSAKPKNPATLEEMPTYDTEQMKKIFEQMGDKPPNKDKLS